MAPHTLRRLWMMGFEEHFTENVRLGSKERLKHRTFYCKNSDLKSC